MKKITHIGLAGLCLLGLSQVTMASELEQCIADCEAEFKLNVPPLKASKLDLEIGGKKKPKKSVKKKLVKKKAASKKKKAKKKAKNYGLSGLFTGKGALGSADKAFSASVTWKPDPKDYAYFKVGLKHDLSVEDDQFSYSWGLGYDDWHEGTWNFQINHWGGIKPGEGLDSHNSIASSGYKFKSDFLAKHRLKSAITVAKQLGGNSDFKLSSSLQWSPAQYWYIKAILVKPVSGDDAVWNYVMGYDDWHPNTWSIEYSNYNANTLYETTFKKSGKIAISYKWKL